MIHGIGTDILAVARMGDAASDEVFVRKTFTEAERAEAAGRDNPNMYYCTRFSGKEAVFKALGMDPNRARLNEIEILADEFGAPHVTLHGRMADFAAGAGISCVHVSLSWETDYAVAFAVAEK